MGTEAASSDGTPEDRAASPRRPWLAGLLTLFGAPLGHVYAGRPGRGLALVGAFYSTLVLQTAALLAFPGRLTLFAGVLPLALSVFIIVDAYRVAKAAPRPYRLRRCNRIWIYAATLVAFAVFNDAAIDYSRAYVHAFRIPAGSMEPTLAIGDHVLVDLRRSPPSRGEVVVFPYPEDPSKIFIKRIIGLPGETIEIRAKRVFINGAPLDEPYAQTVDDGMTRVRRDEMRPETLAAGEYFVMGDNRDRSYDSRFWGAVPAHSILGRARFIYFSWGDQGILWNRIGKAIE